jgi:Ca2+-binding RTX toxin-like protein
LGTASDGDTLANIENVLGSGSADTLTGNSASNVLSGGDGSDTLVGGGGGDVLSGGRGNDILTGSATEKDSFYFTDLAGTDTVTNFLRANGDVLVVDLSVFSLGASFTAAELVNSAGHVASGAIAQFIYDTDTQQLWFDADGSGATNAAIHIATLTGGPASLLLSDFAIIE